MSLLAALSARLLRFQLLYAMLTVAMAASVDQVNVADYEFSSLLYLNTVSTEHSVSANSFQGAWFAFNDEDCDRLVAPRAGRLLAFTSGFENLHQVQPIRNGNRFVLAAWFRRLTSEEQENPRSLKRQSTRSGIVLGGVHVEYNCSTVAAAVALGVGVAHMLGWWSVGWW